jgi:hypothetical protein
VGVWDYFKKGSISITDREGEVFADYIQSFESLEELRLCGVDMRNSMKPDLSSHFSPLRNHFMPPGTHSHNCLDNYDLNRLVRKKFPNLEELGWVDDETCLVNPEASHLSRDY